MFVFLDRVDVALDCFRKSACSKEVHTSEPAL